MSNVDDIAAALAPYVEAAVQAAVAEAERRLAPAAPLVGTVGEVVGAEVLVTVPGQVEPCAVSSANNALAVGDRVVVWFHPGGTAYAFGPLVGG